MEELIKKARQHDADAFTELMMSQMQTMYKTARAILNNEEDAADAISDTILACWEKLGTAEKADFTNAIDAAWSFDWVLDGSSEKKEYDLNAPVGDTGVTVKHVEISPISLNVTYDFPKKIYNKMDNSSGMLFFPDGVRLKDGTELKGIYLGPGTEGYISQNEYFIAFPVDRILDTDEIDALLVRKGVESGDRYTIPLES